MTKDTSKSGQDNRANQLNPNNSAYWSSRDKSAPAPSSAGTTKKTK